MNRAGKSDRVGYLLMLGCLWVVWVGCGHQSDSVEAVRQRSQAASGLEIPKQPLAKPVASDIPESDWSGWLGPNLDATTTDPETVLAMEHCQAMDVCWEAKLGLGYSSPVVHHDHVFVQDRVGDNERVQAFHLGTGQRVWATQNPATFQTEFPMYTDGPIPTPAVNDRFVVTIGADGYVQCLAVDTGTPLWGRTANSLTDPGVNGPELQMPPFGAGPSPVIINDRLLLALPVRGRRPCLYQLDMVTGKIIWKSISYRCSYASPIVARLHEQATVLLLHDQGLSGIDWESGQEAWNFPYRGKVVDSENAVEPLVHDNQIFLTAYGMPGTLLQVLPDRTVETRWSEVRSLDSQYTNVLKHDHYVLGFSARTKRLHVVDWDSGTTIHRHRLPMTRGRMVKAGNRILILGDQGQAAIVDVSKLPEAGVVWSSDLKLQPKVFCTPCLHGDRVVVRDQQRLVVLRMVPATGDIPGVRTNGRD